VIEGGRTAIVVNPVAAGGRLGRDWPRLRRETESVLGPFEVLETAYPGHATELTREALLGGCTRIISAGGDGTANEVANGFFQEGKLVAPSAAMAVLPYGTGADFKRTIGIPRGAEGLRQLEKRVAQPTDIGRLTYRDLDGAEQTRYFLNVADFGAGGEVVRRVNESRKRLGGFLTFLWAVLTTLALYRNPEMRIRVDGRRYEGRVNNVIIANGQYYGGGMHVAPDASLASGTLETYIIGDVGPLEAMVNLPKLYRGRLLQKADKVRYLRAKRLRAEADSEVLLNVDGEQPGRLPLDVAVCPGALPLVR
jgi:YegS/Rv2252/BmrU family lipid kinase